MPNTVDVGESPRETRNSISREWHVSPCPWWEPAVVVEVASLRRQFLCVRRRCRCCGSAVLVDACVLRSRVCETEFGEDSWLHFVCGCWVHWGGGGAVEYEDSSSYCVDVQEARCGFVVVGVFVLRGFFFMYSLASYSFVLVTVFWRFGILHVGGGCVREKTIVAVAGVVKTASIRTVQVRAFMAVF